MLGTVPVSTWGDLVARLGAYMQSEQKLIQNMSGERVGDPGALFAVLVCDDVAALGATGSSTATAAHGASSLNVA